MPKVFALIFALLFLSVSAPLMAQTDVAQQIVTPAETATTPSIAVVPTEKSTTSNIAADFLNDQKAIWTSPLHLNRGEVEWLAPIGVGAAALFAYDHKISDAVKGDTSLRSPSNAISTVGAYAPYAIPGAMWFLGAINHNSHTAEVGRLGIEAELDTEVVVQVLKFATSRTRPNAADNKSFPSGHAASAFALASVLSSEYHNKPLVVVGSYGFATAVSMARVGGLNHFPSDVLVGAVIGELIGRYVVHHHAQRTAQ